MAVRRWQDSEARDKPLVIYSDSQYALKTCSEWMYGWFARGVVKMNWDIVSELYNAISPLRSRISFVHVRGHQKIKATDSEYEQFVKKGNAQADKLATAASAASK